jgi:hypothetical protein
MMHRRISAEFVVAIIRHVKIARVFLMDTPKLILAASVEVIIRPARIAKAYRMDLIK